MIEHEPLMKPLFMEKSSTERQRTLFLDLPDEVLIQIYDCLPLSTIKQLRLYPELAFTMQHQIYRQGEYSILIDDEDEDEAGAEGHKISELQKNGNDAIHVAIFQHYRVNITLCDFKSSIDNLLKYDHLIREIFDRPRSVTVKLVVILHYSLNRFTDVKDCLSNIDLISKLFNPKGINVCSVDLQLNKKS